MADGQTCRWGRHSRRGRPGKRGWQKEKQEWEEWSLKNEMKIARNEELGKERETRRKGRKGGTETGRKGKKRGKYKIARKDRLNKQ